MYAKKYALEFNVQTHTECKLKTDLIPGTPIVKL
jgi:hypothetical protein